MLVLHRGPSTLAQASPTRPTPSRGRVTCQTTGRASWHCTASTWPGARGSFSQSDSESLSQEFRKIVRTSYFFSGAWLQGCKTQSPGMISTWRQGPLGVNRTTATPTPTTWGTWGRTSTCGASPRRPSPATSGPTPPWGRRAPCENVRWCPHKQSVIKVRKESCDLRKLWKIIEIGRPILRYSLYTPDKTFKYKCSMIVKFGKCCLQETFCFLCIL